MLFYIDMDIVVYLFISIVGILLGRFLYSQNKDIVHERHTLGFEFLPREFHGFTIVHLSDLHNKWFGTQQQHLVDGIRISKPDIIVMTGDMVDGIFYHPEPTLALIRQLQDIAPMYYVTGNHEWKIGDYDTLRRSLLALGVHILDNRSETIMRNDRAIVIAGMDDYRRYGNTADPKQTIRRELSQLYQTIDSRLFKILLVHRPEHLREYMEYPFNLIFSGHAHGGQWNLPFFGPLFAPGQGMFPDLVSGAHRRHKTAMVISRGIGNSGYAFQRLFNKPAIVTVVLHQSAV